MKSKTEQEFENLTLFDVTKHVEALRIVYLYRNQEVLIKAIKMLAKIIKETHTVHYE